MPFWRSNARIGREADAWIARLHAPDRDGHIADLEAWRAADPRHEAAFRRSEQLWHDLGSATRTTPLSAPQAESYPYRKRQPARVVLGSLITAGAIVAAIFIHDRASTDVIGPRTYRQSTVAAQMLRLPDGSEVQLGPNSQISTDYKNGIRAVALLNGNARFSVAHDAAHPFIVTAAGRTVTARGTIFDVAIRPNGLAVTMIEGVVDVARKRSGGTSARDTFRLARGERLVVDGEVDRISKVDGTAANDTARIYPPTAVAQIVADANIGASKPIRFADPALSEAKLQGRFDLSDTASLAEQIAAALDLELRDDGHSLILIQKKARSQK